MSQSMRQSWIMIHNSLILHLWIILIPTWYMIHSTLVHKSSLSSSLMNHQWFIHESASSSLMIHKPYIMGKSWLNYETIIHHYLWFTHHSFMNHHHNHSWFKHDSWFTQHKVINHHHHSLLIHSWNKIIITHDSWTIYHWWIMCHDWIMSH